MLWAKMIPDKNANPELRKRIYEAMPLIDEWLAATVSGLKSEDPVNKCRPRGFGTP